MLLRRIASGKAVRTAVGSSACKAFQKQPAVLRKAVKTGVWLKKIKFSVLHDFFKIFLAILLTIRSEYCNIIIA